MNQLNVRGELRLDSGFFQDFLQCVELVSSPIRIDFVNNLLDSGVQSASQRLNTIGSHPVPEFVIVCSPEIFDDRSGVHDCNDESSLAVNLDGDYPHVLLVFCQCVKFLQVILALTDSRMISSRYTE